MSAPSPAEVTVHVESEDEGAFRLDVRVVEGTTETRHQVTLSRALLARLAPRESAEAFVRKSFAFLLEREPKESILRRFDVSIISRYFPEYERTIAG